MIMEIDKVIVSLGGISAIAFVAWFFFGKKEEVVEAGSKITIAVAGGYNPSVIQLQKGKKTTLTFVRTDPSSCLEEVNLPEFKIRKTLPLNENVAIELIPNKVGEFPFSCGMNMYHGKVLVRD